MTSERQQNEADGEIYYYKVGFVGPGGTGKTSVLNILKDEPDVLEPIQPSIVRGVYQKLGVRTEFEQNTMTLEEKWELQKELAKAKFYQDKTNPFGIFDRTPIDHFNYGLYRCAGVIKEEEFNEVQELVRYWMGKYDLVYFFPIYNWGGQQHRDGFREEGLAYRYTTQYIMKGMLEDMEIDYCEMADWSAVERAQFVLEDIRRLRASRNKPKRFGS